MSIQRKSENSHIIRNSIISILLIAVLLIVIPIITAYLLTQAYDGQIRGDTSRTSTSIRQTVRAFVDGAYNLSYELAVNPSILTMDSDIQTPILEESAERNEYIELLYIQGTDGMQIARSSGVLGDRSGRQWFLEIMEHKQPNVFQSYYSIATGMPCTSIFIPMFVGSEMVGVLGTDIKLEYLQQLAEEHADYDSGRYSFIIDGKGVVIAHPDNAYLESLTNFDTMIRTIYQTDDVGNVLLNSDGSVVTREEAFIISDKYQAVIQSVMAGNRGLEIIEEEDNTYYASYESISMPGYSEPWSVITLQDRDIAMGVISQLMRRMVVIISLIFTICVVIAVVFFQYLRRTLNRLEIARNDAEKANKSKSAFLSTMSHEIRTPMNAILGVTEIQLQNANLAPAVKEAFDRIYTSGDMLLGIINDILDLSKIEAGKLELIIGKYEMASMLSDTAQLNMMRIGSKSIEFRLNIKDNIPVAVLGDELRVKQILNNLLSNAFKYTNEGKVSLSVSVKEDNGHNDQTVTLKFCISDTGQGMTEEQVAKLFEEYSRFNLEANRMTEGTGLGMSITRNLIRIMGGEIFVESVLGEGSTVTVYLPQGKTDSSVLGKELVDNLCLFRTPSMSQMKRVQISREPMPYGSVMIVDDVETNIYVAKGLLAPYDLKIDSADSGFEAIEMVKSGKEYDIIFMDHMMPEMDGLETTNIIRAMGYTRPIVALTANAVAGQAEVFLGNGFDDFISKPIDVRQLNVILNKLVRDKQPPEVIEAARRQAEKSPPVKEPRSGVDEKIAEIFVRDASKSLPVIKEITEKQGSYTDDEIRKYVIHVHGLKSALANIGKMELSSVAFKLEMAGREGNTQTIVSETPEFLRSMEALFLELIPKSDGEVSDMTEEDTAFLYEKLLVIAKACEEFDERVADEVLEELRQKSWPPKANELLKSIAENLLHSDFDAAQNEAAEYADVLSSQAGTGSKAYDRNERLLRMLNREDSPYRKIDGLDIDKGLEKFDNNGEIYLKVLQSYVNSVRTMLTSIESVSEDTLVKYKISVHGIKGASFDIFAEEIGEKAKALEIASEKGDIAFVYEHNSAFLELAEKFIGDLEKILSGIEADLPKPKKERPDDEVLLRLLTACKEYNMDGADAAMAEIDKYQYESDEGLAEWLLKNVGMMNFTQVVERLSTFLKI